MTWFRAGGGGIPASLKNGMNAVLNKKFGTSGQTYAPSNWPDDVNLLGKLPEKTVSGALVNIADGADDVPIKALSCSIVPQGGNGTPSSPVPITGTSKITLTHAKANLLKTVAESKTQNGVTWTVNADGTITLENTSTARTYLYVRFYHKILPQDATLTVSVEGLYDNGASDVFVNIVYSNDGSTYAGSYGQCTWANPSRQINYTADKYIGFYIDCPANVTTNQTIKIMVSVGSTAFDFVPYAEPDTYEIDMPVGKNLVDWKVSSTTFEFVLASGTYTLSWDGTLSSGNWYFRGYDENGDLYEDKADLGLGAAWTHASSHWNYASLTQPFSFVVPSGCTKLEIFKQNADGTVPVQIEAGSSATVFIPYKTVFGGSYEKDGKLTEKFAYRYISDFSWIKQTASNRDFFLATSSIMTQDSPKDILCDILPYGGEITVAAMSNKTIASWQRTLRIYDTDIADVTELLNTYGKGRILYPLANPTEVQIDPLPQINTHLGVNNFWTDVNGGETEVTYRADIDLALAQLSGTRGLMMASRSVSPMIGEEASLDRENILEEVSENSDNEESEEER